MGRCLTFGSPPVHGLLHPELSIDVMFIWIDPITSIYYKSMVDIFSDAIWWIRTGYGKLQDLSFAFVCINRSNSIKDLVLLLFPFYLLQMTFVWIVRFFSHLCNYIIDLYWMNYKYPDFKSKTNYAITFVVP